MNWIKLWGGALKRTALRSQLCLLLFSAMACVNAAAEEPLVDLFPDARPVYSMAPKRAEYRLTLSALKKVNNRWRIDREERLDGLLSRHTLELPENESFSEAKRRLNQGIEQYNARLLFACDGMDCGSSSGWANEVFNIKQLYGLDVYQYYNAWEIQAGGELYYAALYLVQRGNHRTYLQMDLLKVPLQEKGTVIASPDTILLQLNAKGYVVLSGVEFEGQELTVNEGHLKAVVDALRKNYGLSLRIVGHDYGPYDSEAQEKLSLSYANTVYGKLVELGAPRKRLKAYGLGSLAPAGKRGMARIELVKDY